MRFGEGLRPAGGPGAILVHVEWLRAKYKYSDLTVGGTGLAFSLPRTAITSRQPKLYTLILAKGLKYFPLPVVKSKHVRHATFTMPAGWFSVRRVKTHDLWQDCHGKPITIAQTVTCYARISMAIKTLSVSG